MSEDRATEQRVYRRIAADLDRGRTLRTLSAVFAILGFAAIAWGQYAGGPEVLCLEIGMVGCGVSAVLTLVALGMRIAASRRRR